MSGLRKIYLALAVLGAVHSLYWFGRWALEGGFDVSHLANPLRVGAANGGLAWELALAVVTLTVWVLAEIAVRRNWIALIAIPATLVMGIGCGLPLYLFLRTRPVH
ncbi:DUF2834 domain-containing protein [Pontibaca salina]|uniref:DUF2834 domain-containing protein n=1 Tax=Pontibaca salina TaxID=2795731 RepID=A0A934M2E2_9RHOB|nr:DUF2834 domain-containing protein [Pontibaca salina]MBI6628724.1 DUF2834 domain-containing protein [Pontibaca salina]